MDAVVVVMPVLWEPAAVVAGGGGEGDEVGGSGSRGKTGGESGAASASGNRRRGYSGWYPAYQRSVAGMVGGERCLDD